MLHGAATVQPGRLWVVVDGPHDGLVQRFSTTIDGKPYRSDETLAYDARSRTFVQREIDQNGARIVLAAKAPYAPSMTFEGLLSLAKGRLYRMRAKMSVDAAGRKLETSTSFFVAAAKGYVEQSRGICTKV